ncbi:uncharacterized protein MYCFIDRAFT_211587 [Pseudocercospora fijiensis CIRAD86]|uniref:Ecp2 effector protein domain-containing protein n=1 Tax=Pseudocercospora fijiensis (strain CIRAD86) TaxID=383855 RepID=M2ZTG3_PSEFD|nr:uncharacterized protein MYCFIDRAFT_211587 [Pseudocercospora fijiensis CIRAD86]EME82289.1 hypothetical protein MYCFIDRAFT_211587 [Pseudocercospora fijiensis CIRAD86]
MPSMRHLAALGASMAVACALSLPQGTTGPSGGFSPYPQNTSITYYNGLSAAAGADLGAVHELSSSAVQTTCGKAVGEDVIQVRFLKSAFCEGFLLTKIKSLYCTPLRYSGVAIAQTVNGSCTFTLFSDTDSCSLLGQGAGGAMGFGYNKHVIVIPNGDESTCIATGVGGGGTASGVWACG